MELILKNADVFKKSMEAIAVLIDEAELIISSKGIELKATDPSQISMVDFSLPKKAFEQDFIRQILAYEKIS